MKPQRMWAVVQTIARQDVVVNIWYSRVLAVTDPLKQHGYRVIPVLVTPIVRKRKVKRG